MEIHSSSLASIPIGHSAKNRNDETQLPANQKAKNSLQIQPPLSLPSPKAKVGDLTVADLSQLTDELEKQNNSTANTQNGRALNAYIQENIQPLKNQRSSLISGINLFA